MMYEDQKKYKGKILDALQSSLTHAGWALTAPTTITIDEGQVIRFAEVDANRLDLILYKAWMWKITGRGWP